MEVLGVIPARYDSTRFPGKVLAELHGKPLLQYVYERAKKARLLDELIVACDDERIIEAVRAFEGRVISTSKAHPSGTDRLREAIADLDTQDLKIVINIQGDEPLIHPTMIDDVASCLLEDASIPMATLMRKIENSEDIDNPNVVKVVTDKQGFALYFSRSPIPYGYSQERFYYKHIGLYGYQKDFLFTFANLSESMLEKMERLEQLRALENGYRIKVIETGFDTIGVDTPQDLEKVKKVIHDA